MFSIIWWIFWTILGSVSSWYYKKALTQSTLSKPMFKFFVYLFWAINIWILLYFFWFEKEIITNYKILIILFLLAFSWVWWSILHLVILKNAKLSELLPYEDLDKLFVIIFWYFLFFWTNNGSSIITLAVAILTLVLVIAFTIDFKNLKVPKNIWILIFYKLLRSVITLTTWYVLISYESSTIYTSNWIFELLVYIIIIFAMGDSFKSIASQTKWFYISRFNAVFFWIISWIISLFLIKELWVIVWTLFWFLWIATSIFSMKLILNDSPTKKQILLALMVILLIWIWYFYK